MSMAFETELVLFLSMQKSYLKDLKKGERQIGYRYGIYNNIHKQGNNSWRPGQWTLIGEKKRKQKPVLQFKSRICFVSQSADVMRKTKSPLHFSEAFPKLF